MEQLDLSDFFKTKSQATDFALRLSAVTEKMYETNFDLEKAFMEQLGIQKKDKFISFLRDNNVNYQSNSDLKNFLTKIQERISTLPLVTIILAIEPNEEIIKSLSDWFFLNLKKQVLFDIQVDPKIIAGTTMTYSGKYIDFSLKPIFDEILKTVVPEKISNNVSKDTSDNVSHENQDGSYYTKYHATPLKYGNSI